MWLTDEPQLVAGFMDRNLGAESATATDGAKTRGLYYQFGRKDPFVGSTEIYDINGTSKSTGATIATGKVTFAKAVQTPATTIGLRLTTTHQRTGTTFQRVTARLSLTHAQRDGDCQPRLNIATSQPRHSLGMQQILVVPITAIGSLLLVVASATSVAWATWAATAAVGVLRRSARMAVTACTSAVAACILRTTAIELTVSPCAVSKNKEELVSDL